MPLEERSERRLYSKTTGDKTLGMTTEVTLDIAIVL